MIILFFHRKISYIVRKLSSTCAQQTDTSDIMKVLNVAEKNDAAKRIAEMLSNGNSSRREGFSKYNKIYEFNYDLLNQRNCKMIMTSLSGHLMNYEFTGTYKSWHGCHPLSLFEAEVEKTVTQDMLNIKKTLEREVRSCQSLIIWTDCDREGENIGYEVIDVCMAIKPSIRVYRARFSEITKRSVSAACANLVQPNQNVSDAVDVRQQLDLRIGASFTRFQTMRLQKVFPQVLSDKLISYGPCQFPTLGFVVERFKAREAFIPEDFWKIEVEHTQEDCTAKFNWKRGRLFDQLSCQVLYDECIEPPAIAMVTSVTAKPKSKWRPVAMDTVEMEKLASRKLRMSASEAMKAAEKLYTKGYPRTETNIFPKDIDLHKIISEQTGNNNWGNFARGLLEIGPTPRNGSKSDKAHPPIHPIKHATDLASNNEARLYELITRHFLACCHRDAQGHETTVEIDLSGEKFTAQGLMILERNYLEVYTYERWNAKTIPNYKMGDEFEPHIEMTGGQTTAPALLTEADLIALMDKHGIGTDATHAEHIETLKKRLYIGMTNDRRLTPGELGMGLVNGYDLMGEHLSGPNLRSEVESDIQLICQGRAQKEAILQKYVNKYREIFKKAIDKASKLDEALAEYFGTAQQISNQAVLPVSDETRTVRNCPLCGKIMVLKQTQSGKYMVTCTGYPTCRNAAFFPASILQATVSDEMCRNCGPGEVHKLAMKFNRRSIPAYMQEESVECICGCNSDMQELFDIRFRSTASTAPPPSRPRQPSRPMPSQRSNNHYGNNNGGSNNYRGNSNSNRNNNHYGNRRNNSQSSNQRAVKCRCNNEAIRKTVMKDGPNQGRQFFTCDKPRENQCGFFEWCPDIQDTTSSPPNNFGPSNSSRPSTNSSNRTRRAPTCGLCGESGHTRRSCPQK